MSFENELVPPNGRIVIEQVCLFVGLFLAVVVISRKVSLIFFMKFGTDVKRLAQMSLLTVKTSSQCSRSFVSRKKAYQDTEDSGLPEVCAQ